MAVYTVLIAGFDFVFSRNILDLRALTVEIEKWFGPWPWYIAVNMVILAMWYHLIHKVDSGLNAIHSRV